MNYSRLTWSIDSKIVGVRDGVGPCYLDEDFYKRHPWYAQIFMPSNPKLEDNDWWTPRANMPEYGGALLQIPMEKRAKHTDFIDFGGFQHGYLVNSRLRELLERARLPKHHYFPATFRQGDTEVEGYWWLCYDLETGKESVDFKNSNFLISTNGRLWNEEVSIASYADYLQIIKETDQAAHASRLQFKPSFDQSLDIWGVQFLSSVKGYISDRLAGLFYQEKITGFELKKLKCALLFE